ncbi:MAG: hypothetical protein WC784_01445 [Candidatus Shapirobacteria bacterium]|jgi:hypothetical protein
MANNVEDISKMITDSREALRISRELENQKKSAELNKMMAEFNVRYEDNLANLKATGIVEVFIEIIEKEVVILSPAQKETRVAREIPKKPAFISWLQPEFKPPTCGYRCLSDFYDVRAEIDLNFDLHFQENPWSDSGGSSYVPKTLEALFFHNEFRLGYGDNISGISREDLIQKVGEKIIRLKGLELPQARK